MALRGRAQPFESQGKQAAPLRVGMATRRLRCGVRRIWIEYGAIRGSNRGWFRHVLEMNGDNR